MGSYVVVLRVDPLIGLIPHTLKGAPPSAARADRRRHMLLWRIAAWLRTLWDLAQES